MNRELDLAAYRLLVRFTLLASIALVVVGLYGFLQGDWLLGVAGVAAGVVALYPSQYFRIRPEAGAEYLLIFLTRPDCTLCDEARAVLRIMTDGTPFSVQELNIMDNRRLRKRFQWWIPVVLWQGEVVARLRIDPTALHQKVPGLKPMPTTEAPAPASTA